MRFLVDAQLPRRLAHRLREAGFDTLHTLDLPAGNRTSDDELLRLASAQERIMVTKDADFVDALLIRDVPERLLLIATGNIHNRELERIVLGVLPELDALFDEHRFIDLDAETIRVRF